MLEHRMKIQHLMQSMSDLAELILNFLQAFYILCSLSDKHSQLIQQIKVMCYEINRTEKGHMTCQAH